MKETFETPYLPLPRWGRWLLMSATLLGALAYSVLLGAAAGNGSARFTTALIALPVVVISLGMVGHYFQFCVLALPLTALTLPILELGTGTASSLPLSLLLTLGLCAIWVIGMYRHGWRLAPSPLNLPLAIFCAICVVSLAWGVAWRDPVLIDWPDFIVTQAGALITILASPAAAMLIGNFVTSRRQVAYILGAFIVLGLLMTLSQMSGLSQVVLNDRGLWALWFCVPIMALLLAQPAIRWYWRAALSGLLGLNLFHTMITNSLWISGWLPNLVGILAVAFLYSRRLFFALLLIVALVGSSWLVSYVEDVTQANVEEGGLGRLSLWEQNWRVVSDHWLFGTGPAGYAIYYMTFFRDDARSTHNNYLDILAQFGFAGTLIWLWFSAAAVWEGWRLIRRAPPGILRTAALAATGGWIAAMASMMLGDWVLPFAYNQGISGFKYTVYSWIFVGLLISIRQILDAEERAKDSLAHASA